MRSRLNQGIGVVLPVLTSADAAPTVQVRELADFYAAQIDEQLVRLDAVLAGGVAEMNRLTMCVAPAQGLCRPSDLWPASRTGHSVFRGNGPTLGAGP